MLTLNAFATLAILSTLVAGIPLPRNENEAASSQSYAPTTVTTVGDDEILSGSQKTEKRGYLTIEGLSKLPQELAHLKPRPKPESKPGPKLDRVGRIKSESKGPKLERLPNVREQKYESLVDALPQTRFAPQQRQFQKRAWPTAKEILALENLAKKPKSQNAPIQRINQFPQKPYYQRQNQFVNPVVPATEPAKLQRVNQISKQPEPKAQAPDGSPAQWSYPPLAVFENALAVSIRTN
ncbi:hypothetical protein HYFRA_00009851 [Hymenoscyphus fraxineus]|uniref:Uncharacterized protein n=1 Tax=Hymenoscyphus fraxineus TaxID=746836 RepID=A0A9N9PSX6_9HELO|nr:hypothetical protein HYFRA_00009851 [Hymenoscyphus fraxineus]